MSAVDSNILIACATVVAALLGLIGILLGKILSNTRRTVDHVANSHIDEHGNPINLRDDLDDKFGGLDEKLDGVVGDVGGMKSDIRAIRRDQTTDREIASADRRTTAEAHALASKAINLAQQALERTQPKNQPKEKTSE